jgi:hypothetical protein
LNPIKQFGILFLFVTLVAGILFPIIVFATNDFQISTGGILWFVTSLILLGFLVRYIILDELKNRQHNLDCIKQGKPIFEFHYKQEDWINFAKHLYRSERNRYFKIFSIVTFCLILFLVLLAQDDNLSAFTVFSFIIGLIWSPILISNILRFRNRKKKYLDETKPNIRVTRNGIVINSKIHHSFSYINSTLYDVKIENYESKKCFSITTFHPSPTNPGGGSFKTSYIPIPNNEKNTDLYLKELKGMTKPI